MRISDWSSDVCSSDLDDVTVRDALNHHTGTPQMPLGTTPETICRLTTNGLASPANMATAVIISLAPARWGRRLILWQSSTIVCECMAWKAGEWWRHRSCPSFRLPTLMLRQ